MKQLFFLLTIFIVGCTAKSGNGNRFTESHVLSTPAPAITLANPTNFTFAAIGDLHIGQDTALFRRMLSDMQSRGMSFITLLGDLADKGERHSFEAMITALTDYGYNQKSLYAIGNHDVFEDGWTHYKDLLGTSHYALKIGNSKFITLDTADGTVGIDQKEWLVNELGKESVTNIFILSHYLPIIPTQRTYLKLANEIESLDLMRAMENFSVKSWLGGHYHSYVSQKVGTVQYIVCGGGGGRRMEPVKKNFYVEVTVNGDQVTDAIRIVE